MASVSQTTEGFRVTAEAIFVPSASKPQHRHWMFAYDIRIENVGEVTATLRSRVWRIMDGYGNVSTVEGPGVIGEEPRLRPGEAFAYRSGCPLTTPVGTMQGEYKMERDDGTTFDAAIPEFTLAAPDALH